MFMNPFEVREVLQETHVRWQRRRCSQSLWSQGSAASLTTQSASSSNPLNPFEVREVLQGAVSKRWSRNLLSIPLKSGKCCKVMWYSFKPEKDSQSLWSQGSAARVLYKTFLLKSISYLLVFVKNFLTKSYFPKFCKEHILVTEVLWHKFAFDSGFFERCVAFIFQ